MPTHPLVSPEELACLLQVDAPAAASQSGKMNNTEAWLAQAGAGLWLLKGVLLWVALQTLALHSLPGTYLWTRGVLEALCGAVFWSTLHQPAHRKIAWGAAVVGATTLLMDALMLLALPS